MEPQNMTEPPLRSSLIRQANRIIETIGALDIHKLYPIERQALMMATDIIKFIGRNPDAN